MQLNVLRDVLHNLSPESGSNSEYARGVLVGVVATLMAKHKTFEESLQLCSCNAPRIILANSVPQGWNFDVIVYGENAWERNEGLIRHADLLKVAMNTKKSTAEILSKFLIPPDCYNNGGMSEVIDLILAGGDDPEWVLGELNQMMPRFTIEWWHDTEEARVVVKERTLPHDATEKDAMTILRYHISNGHLVRCWDSETKEYMYV